MREKIKSENAGPMNMEHEYLMQEHSRGSVSGDQGRGAYVG